MINPIGPGAAAANPWRAMSSGASTSAAPASSGETAAASGNSETQIAAPAPAAILDSPSWFATLFASPAEEQSFSAELVQRLQAAGVDTSQNITLTVADDGHVEAQAATSDKGKIDAVFAADPELEKEYRKIANTEESTSIAKAMAGIGAMLRRQIELDIGPQRRRRVIVLLLPQLLAEFMRLAEGFIQGKRHQLVLGGEDPEDRPLRHARGPGDLTGGHAPSVLPQQWHGRLDDRLAGRERGHGLSNSPSALPGAGPERTPFYGRLTVQGTGRAGEPSRSGAVRVGMDSLGEQ